MHTTVDTHRICILAITAAVLIALVIAWPYPDFIASAIGLIAGLILGVLSGGRSA
jgi:hypothetical protein